LDGSLYIYPRLIWHAFETGTARFATSLGIIRPVVQQFPTDPITVLCLFPHAGPARKQVHKP
jgi:hypothetical protein